MLRGMLLCAGLLAGLLAPAAASAATRPIVTTGGAANVGIDVATLTGGVDAGGAQTTYFFQYGLTSAYGANTASTPIGNGTTRRPVALPVGALAPATTYHYRLVATNAKGTTKGKDRVFRTRRAPLGVTLAANPNPIAPGGATTLAGTLSGTGNANRQVQLLANPFPYTQGFLPAGNVVVTDAAGNFAVNVLGVALNTQFQVRMEARPEVVSPIAVLNVAVQVGTRTSKRRRSYGARVRFYGTIRPVRNGATVYVQRKLKDGTWFTRGRTAARARDGVSSEYSTRVRVRRSGTFRVLVETAGDLVSNTGREVSITVRRRR